MRTQRDLSAPGRLYDFLNHSIAATVLLSVEEEHALACAASSEARARLILSHLPLVKSIAFRFKGYGLDIKDCFDQGVVGLIAAVDKYDPTCGRLATFAHRFILGEILCYLNKNRKLLHLPESLRRAVNRFCRTLQQLGDGATDTDIAAAMDVKVQQIPFLRECAEYAVESLDAALADSEDARTLADTIGSIDPGFDAIENRILVGQLMSHLSETEREVIQLRYGLNGATQMSYRSIAQHLKRSCGWIVKVEKVALAKMRKHAV